MSRALTISILLMAPLPAAVRAEDLKRLSLDDAATIGTVISTDTQVKVEGRGSIKITTRTVWIDDIVLSREPLK